LVSADVLACALRWEHRLGSSGVSTGIGLNGGRRIESDSVRAVLNRIVELPDSHRTQAAAEDREYATQECVALFISWLAGLSAPVLNRPTAQGLCGRWLRMSEWMVLAARAGLPVPHYRRVGSLPDPDSNAPWNEKERRAKTVFVVAGRATTAPEPIRRGCCLLAELAETDLLEVRFRPAPASPWTFTGATPLPDFRLGGEEVVDLLYHTLHGGNGAHP
jgi:hypothetical protein